MATGPIATFGAITAGSGYANGTYRNVALSGGSGSGATAHITVAGGVVTAVTLPHPSTSAQLDRVGKNYQVNDSLGANAGFDATGGGSGFAVLVSALAKACENCFFGKIVPPSAGANLFGQRYCAKDSYLNQGRPSIGDPRRAQAGLFQADAAVISSHGWETVICTDDYMCGDGADLASGSSFSSIVVGLPASALPGVAWDDFVPAIVPGAGAFTSMTLNLARYAPIGKLVFFHLEFSITTNGTAATSILFTLPVTPETTTVQDLGSGHATGGYAGALRTISSIVSRSATITKPDTTYPGADNTILAVQGHYETS